MARKNGTKKTQSALEYLAVHGWAILLIAVVLILLFRLGVFDLLIMGPRTQPGSCWVSRPNGPGTVQSINLEGLCANGLPEFVMTARGIGDYVDAGNSDNTSSSLNIQGNAITLTAWVYVLGPPFHDVVDKEYQYGMKLDYNNLPHPCSPGNQLGWCLEWDTYNNWIGDGYPIATTLNNTWVFLAVSMNGGTKYWYANGNFLGSMTPPAPSISYMPVNVLIGSISPGEDAGYGTAEWFNGRIANVQIYNTTLSSGDIKQLYLEGIGAEPINLQNLVAWWPLNGDANDYSGNGNNDAMHTITYINTWTNNYTTP